MSTKRIQLAGILKIQSWLKKRGIKFIQQRAKSLFNRYGLTPVMASERINHCVQELDALGCRPTFFVPAVVAKRNLGFIHQLQDMGCEIGVHGYQHVDLTAYPPAESNRQLIRAAGFFKRQGFESSGFRCPYLSASDELMHALTPGVFKYSSNRAVEWPVGQQEAGQENRLFDTIRKFYRPIQANSSLSLPWLQDGLIEIPACVPDDLQMHDGLGMDPRQITAVWIDILGKIHQRGELFNLMFHPELASEVEAPFISVLRAAENMSGKMWVAQLKEVSDWWREKASFGLLLEQQDGIWNLHLSCSPRATVLCRGLDLAGELLSWDDHYQRLFSMDVQLSSGKLPLIGLADDLPSWVATDLQRMGYLVLSGEFAGNCMLYLDQHAANLYSNPVALTGYIEQTSAPIVRFWPWPDGARSALCLTGDLDALSLMDYATRLFPD